MKSYLLFLAIVIINLVSGLVAEKVLAQPIDNDYWMVVPSGFEKNAIGYIYGDIALSLISKDSTHVRIRYGSTKIDTVVTANGIVLRNMPRVPQHKQVVNSGIHVWSLDSLPFSASLTFVGRPNLSLDEIDESTLCIPTHWLGSCYRIASYGSIDSVNGGNVFTFPPEFAVVGTQDNTFIVIEFPPGSNLPAVSVVLNAGEAYHIDCSKPDVNIDPTGALIMGNKPIGVFCGHQDAVIPFGRANGSVDGIANQLLEEMIPINSWDTLHMIVSSPPPHISDSYRFLANEDSTEIFLDGASTVLATINAGEYYEIILSGAHEIYSTKPIMVSQYTQSVGSFITGGPSQLIVPSVNRYFSSARFQVPSDLYTTILDPTLIVIAPLSDTDKVELDGNHVTDFISMPKSSNNPIQYGYTIILNLAKGGHVLKYKPLPSTNANSLYAYFVANDMDRDESRIQNVGYRGRLMPQMKATNVDFGAIICDTVKIDSITVENEGYGPLRIFSIIGKGGSSFTLVNPTTFPQDISPGEKKQFVFRFSNSVPSVYSDTLIFHTNEDNCLVRTFVITARKEEASTAVVPSIIDFGDVYCRNYDTVFTLTNTGTVPDTIVNISFTAVGMEVLSPTLPVVISPNQSREIKVRLSAAAISSGSYTSTLHALTQPCDKIVDIVFLANRKILNYAISPASVNLGATNVGKAIAGKITVTNPNTNDIQINGAYFTPSTFPGTITGPSFPQNLAAGQSMTVDFSCTPPDTAVYNGSLCLEVDSTCINEQCASISIEGVSMCVTSEAAAATLGKKPGDEVIIPIRVASTKNLVTTKEIALSVSYDPELLRLAADPSSSLGKVSKIVASSGEVSFTIQCDSPFANPLAQLHMQALLAPYAEGQIGVSHSTFTLVSGEEIAGNNCSSKFTLDSSCINPSGLKHRSTATIEGIYPNPSQTSTTLAIAVKGSPTVKIEVYNIFGQKIETLYNGELTDGKQEFVIPTKNYYNGMYFCRMDQGGKVIVREFSVQR